MLSKKVANLDEKFVSDLPGGLILAKTPSRMTTATTFSHQNDASFHASTILLKKSGTRSPRHAYKLKLSTFSGWAGAIIKCIWAERSGLQ